jgi:deoxyribonuclease-4
VKFIGGHVSIAGGVQNAPLNAIKIGAKAFALFTKTRGDGKRNLLMRTLLRSLEKTLKRAKSIQTTFFPTIVTS